MIFTFICTHAQKQVFLQIISDILFTVAHQTVFIRNIFCVMSDYVLIGDSQLRRFARYCSLPHDYCYSGCTISKLKSHLKSVPSLPKKVIVMIGSNDLNQNSPVQNLKRDYLSLVKYILRQCDHVILLVCPVILRKRSESSHWTALNYLTSLTYSFQSNSKVDVLNLNIQSSTCVLKPHYFEQYYSHGKIDELHLNSIAFDCLRSALQSVCTR